MENISLRGHNVYESELILGPYGTSVVRDAPTAYGVTTRSGAGSGAERGVQGHRLQPTITDGP